MYVTKERSGPDHLLQIGSSPSQERSLFIRDKRTNSIRLASSPTLAISNQSGRGNKVGGNVVLRKYKKSKTQIAFLGKHKRILNKDGKCLTPHFYENTENNNLTWWNCNGSKSQRWKTKTSTFRFRRSSQMPHTRLYAVSSKKATKGHKISK